MAPGQRVHLEEAVHSIPSVLDISIVVHEHQLHVQTRERLQVRVHLLLQHIRHNA